MADRDTSEMPFLAHLEALRWHLVRSVIAIGVGFAATFFFSRFIFDQILLAPKDPDFITYRLFCKLSMFFFGNESLCMNEIPMSLINTDMSGQFTTDIKVSFFSALVIAAPYIFYELWRFVRPALMEKEKNTTRGFVFVVSFLFLTGILFGYYLIFPLSVNFLGNYQVSEQVSNTIHLGSYISLALTVSMASGIMFELPVMIYILAKLGIVTPEFLRKYRKHALVIVLVLAAIITPPDVTSQILVSIPVFFLYEISIFIAASVNRKRP